MGVVLVPILEGKVDVWKQWCAGLNGAQKAEMSSFNSRYGLTKHVWADQA